MLNQVLNWFIAVETFINYKKLILYSVKVLLQWDCLQELEW